MADQVGRLDSPRGEQLRHRILVGGDPQVGIGGSGGGRPIHGGGQAGLDRFEFGKACIERLGESRLSVVERPTHRRVLGSLAWEEEGNIDRSIRRLRSLVRLVERFGYLPRTRADEGYSVAEVPTTECGGHCVVTELTFRHRFE